MKRELSPFERWMVKSNVENLQEYGGLEVVCARLLAGGYCRVAAAVRQTVEGKDNQIDDRRTDNQ